jgi:hypothetical protein
VKISRNCVKISRNCVVLSRAIASEPCAICVGSAERARFASERSALCVGAQCDVRQCDASPSLDASCRWRAGAAVGSGRCAVLPSHSPAP